MKTYLIAFAMCQSMFCSIPFPGNLWDDKGRDKMLLFLPLVGLEIGGIWAALAWLTRLLMLPSLVSGLILCVYPFLVTGFLHLDGFMDVTDAVKSCRDLDRRREILKDSHVGSFAVIAVVILMLAEFSLFASCGMDSDFRILCLVPVVSRACSALAVTCLPPMTTSQYANQHKPKAHIWIFSALLAAAVAAGFAFCGKYGFALIGCLAGYGLALSRAYHNLQGMNGDISGYALTIGELCAVAVYALL